jgi:UDP-glucose:(heptosyl)LPS alpha-1,3-glucosyltransferase
VKIALVIFHADASRGGAERYTLDLSAALVKEGHDVSLLASCFAPNTPGRPVMLDARGWTRAGSYRKFLDALDRHLVTECYEMLHAMLPVRRCDLYHPHAGLAIESHRNDSCTNRLNAKRRLFAAVERQLLSQSNPPGVLCLSNYIQASVQRNYCLPSNKLLPLFNSVDLQKFDPTLRPDAGQQVRKRLSIGADRIVALMIAQDFQRKGLPQAIMGLQSTDPRLVLLVVGREKPMRYVRLAARWGLLDRVFFAGPTDDPYSFYQAADLFVLPTWHDPCSLVVLEALAMGVPVISTVFNGACDIMTNGVQGIVLDRPDNLQALTVAYNQLLDPTVRQRMRDAALQLRPQLSQEHHLARLNQIYSSISHSHSGSLP